MTCLCCYMQALSSRHASWQIQDALLAGAMSAGRSATLQRTAEQGGVKAGGMTVEAEGVGMTGEEMIVIGAVTAAVVADMTGHAGIESDQHVLQLVCIHSHPHGHLLGPGQAAAGGSKLPSRPCMVLCQNFQQMPAHPTPCTACDAT